MIKILYNQIAFNNIMNVSELVIIDDNELINHISSGKSTIEQSNISKIYFKHQDYIEEFGIVEEAVKSTIL